MSDPTIKSAEQIMNRWLHGLSKSQRRRLDAAVAKNYKENSSALRSARICLAGVRSWYDEPVCRLRNEYFNGSTAARDAMIAVMYADMLTPEEALLLKTPWELVLGPGKDKSHE